MTRARTGRLARALAVLAWLATAVSARAQGEKDVLRPCTTADLVGTWQVIRLGVAPSAHVDRRDPYFYPHQRYVFSANATMRHLTSTTPITPAAHRALLARATPTTWALDAEGRLVMQRDGEVRVDTATCEVLTRNVIDPRTGMPSWPGDVLFTHRDRADTPVVRRQLRRLTGLGE